MFTRIDKALIAALVAIIFWCYEAATTGDWSGAIVLEGAITTVLVYLIPNRGYSEDA